MAAYSAFGVWSTQKNIYITNQIKGVLLIATPAFCLTCSYWLSVCVCTVFSQIVLDTSCLVGNHAKGISISQLELQSAS